MANPFYDAPTTNVAGDTSPGAFSPSSQGKVSVTDNTYSSGNPFAPQATSWQQGIHATRYNNAVAASKAAAAKQNTTPSIGETIHAIPHAASDILSNAFSHPLSSGESVLGGLMDAGPAAVNVLSNIGRGMLTKIYGAAGIKVSNGDAPIDLPLPGQTVNEYIGNNSDVSKALQTGAKTVSSYELGGAAARGLGFGGVTVDALGNTIPRATLFSRVAGNVIGGQLITDPKATLADRTKQAAFDAAFGIADTAVRGVVNAAKASKAATAAVNDAKSGVMSSAISTFEDASNPAYNPGVAGKLRAFLESKTYDSSSNMVKFETNLQKALGEDFNDAMVQKAIQPIINDGHKQVATAVGVTEPKSAPVRFKPADLIGNLDDAAKKLETTPKEAPKVKYVAKDSLGTDEYGHKRMAQTQVDTHTGNAVVYYDKSLDANPDAKKIIIDHEQGHILDKQLNGGSNLSSEIGNYQGNRANLDQALGDFAKRNGNNVAETAANLKADMETLSGGKGPLGEQFADAVAAYRQDPKGAFERAPTFAKLMNYVPHDGAISEHSTSLETLKHESPIAGKEVDQKLTEAKENTVYHGTKADLKSISQAEPLAYGDPQALYGPGVYVTDSADIARGYAETKGAGSNGKVLSAQLKSGLKFLNLDKPLGSSERAAFEDVLNSEVGDFGRGTESLPKGITGAEAMKLIRNNLSESGATKSEGGEMLYGLQQRLGDELGYDGFAHVGGVDKGTPHNVKILFDYGDSEKPISSKIERDLPASSLGEKKTSTSTKTPKIASTGLDTGKKVEGRLSFNPEKINAPQDVENLFNKMETEHSSFSDQRISKSNEDIKDLSRLVGLKPEDLINAKPGSIANAETLTAARQLVLNKAQAFADHLKSIDLANASDEQLKALRDDYTRLAAMQQTVAGLRTEAANTLRSLSIEVQPGEDFTLKEAFGELQKFGNKMGWDTDAFASKVGDDLQKTRGQKIASGFIKTWYAAILSGPPTYIRHFIGVESNGFMDTLSKGFNPKTMGEIATSFQTALKSVPEAFAEFKKVFKTGEENPNFNEIKKDPVFSENGRMPNFAHNANLAIEFTGRSMTALNEGYKKIFENIEKASSEVTAPEMTQEVSTALSKAYADQISYMGTPKGPLSQKLLAGAKTMTKGTYNPIRLLIPFTNVVANIIDRQFDYLPGTSMIRAFDIDGGLSQQTEAIMTKYELTGAENRMAIFQRLKDQQIGRMTMGMTLTVPIAIAAHAGLVTGNGPSNYNQKTELEQTGWKPNSVKIGDVYVPYAFFGPLSAIFSMAGNIADAAKYDKNLEDGDFVGMVSKGVLGFGQSELSGSFLSGVSGLLGALSDPSKATNYFKRLGADIIPVPKAAIFAVGAARTAAGDNYQYKTTSVVDKVRAELGLTGTMGGIALPLEPANDAFGEPLKADLIYGLTPGISKPDMVDSYLQANDIVITIPSRGTKYTDESTGKKTKLTAEQYNTYTKESGKLIYQNLEAMIPGLQGEDIDTQRSEIRSMLDEVRTEIRGEVMSTKN